MKHTYLLITLLIFSPLAVSQECKDSITASTPNSRFSINGQEVTDTETGLIWKKCPLGKIGYDCRSTGSSRRYKIFNWLEALQEAETETQKTGKAWRLPNIKELRSIVEEKCHDPAINLAIFPSTNNSIFWSSSPYTDSNFPDRGSHAWAVSFDRGFSRGYFKSSDFSVRLVRTGQ